VKITDFGIALLPTGTRTLAGNVFGSPRYTSPEQVMGRPVDGRSDIFSLGAVVYEMLTGASPFGGGDLNTILKQVLSEPTAPPSSHNPKLPRAFDHIVGKALAKDPNDRYQDAREMANDLRQFDTLEFDSAAPSPLAALEHPTHPFIAPAQDVLDAHDPLLAPDEPDLGPARAAWSKQPRAIIGAAVVAIAVAVVALVALSDAPKQAPTAALASTASTSGTIAASPPPAPAEPATQPLALVVAAPPESTPPVAPAGDMTAATSPPITPAPPPKPMGRVQFAVTPWGEVYVDGRKRGVSPPMQELRLPPGPHAVEIRNSTFEPYRETVNVTADGIVRIKHKFP